MPAIGVGIISAGSAVLSYTAGVASYTAGVASYIGWGKIAVATVGVLSYYSESFRSISTDVVTGVGNLTGLDLYTYSIFCAIFLYMFNEPFLNFKSFNIKQKFLIIFVTNIILLSLLAFAYLRFEYISQIYKRGVINISWKKFVEEYFKSLLEPLENGKLLTLNDIITLYLMTSLSITLSILLLKNFPWKHIVLPVFYCFTTFQFFDTLIETSESLRERLGKFAKRSEKAIGATINGGVEGAQRVLISVRDTVVENARRVAPENSYFIESRKSNMIQSNIEIFKAITPDLFNQLLKNQENSLSDVLKAIAFMSLRGDTLAPSPTDLQFAAAKLTGVISEDGTYVPQLNAFAQLIAGKVAGLLPDTYAPQLNALTTGLLPDTYVPQLNALTTKNEGNKFHVMSIKHLINSFDNEIFREAVRASYQIVSKDNSNNHFTFFKLKRENFIEFTDGYISLIDPITKEIVRGNDDKQILIGPALQNTQQSTNQLTTGSILSDSETQEIKNVLSKQLKLKYSAEESEESKQLTVQSLAVDNKFTYTGNYPNGEGVLQNTENGEIYTVIWKEGNLTTIQTPEYFGNIIDYSKFRIEKINNEYYLTYNGNLLVVVNSKDFDDNQLENIDPEFVKNFQEYYLGKKKSKTIEEIGEELYTNLERSTLDMAGEIFGNALGAAAVVSLGVTVGSYFAPTWLGTAFTTAPSLTATTVMEAGAYLRSGTQLWYKKKVFTEIPGVVKYGMNLTSLWIGIGAIGTSGIVSATRGTFGSTFDYIFLKYKKEHICIQNKELYCKKVNNGDQDLDINQCIIRLKENVLKLILVFNDLLSYSYKLYNDNRSILSVSKYADPLDNSVKNFIANYCSSDCSKLMNTLQELLYNNPNLKILNKFIQFYQYNDVNFNKGVFDWIFLLNDVINVFFENNDDQIKYIDTTFNPMSKDGINLYEQLYSSDFSFIDDIEENNERVKYITKSMLQESIDKYIDDIKSASEPPTFTVNQNFSVKYENIEKLFNNILILNEIIVVPPEKYDSIYVRAFIFFQHKTIIQYFNYGPYQIVNETESNATVIDLRKTPPKRQVKKLDLVDDFVAYSNVEDEASEIFSPMVFLDIYQFKLLEQDDKYLDLFSANHYDTQAPNVKDIKKQYQKSITYVNNNPLQDMYILLNFVNAKSINKKDGDFSHFPFMTATSGKNSDYSIRLLKIEKIVNTNNIYQYVNDADFYIPLLNFYDSKNIKYLKDFNRYITRHVNYLKFSDPTNNTYTEFKPEIDILTNKFPFEMELDVYSLRTIFLDGSISSEDEKAIEEGKLPKGKKKSILINSEILNDLCENYTSYLKQIKPVVDKQLSRLNSFSEHIQKRDGKFADYFISFVRKTTYTRIPEDLGKRKEFGITFTDATDLFIFKKVISDIPLKPYICTPSKFTYEKYDECTLFSVNDVFKQNNFFIPYDKSNKKNEIVNLELNNLPTKVKFVNTLSVNSVSFHNVHIDNLINMEFFQEFYKKLNILSSISDKSKDIKITMQLNQISLCKYLNFNLIVYNFPPKDEQSNHAKTYVEINISQLQWSSSIFSAGKQTFKLPFHYLYINKEIYLKDNFIKNYKALQRSYTYGNDDKRTYKFQNIDEIIKPTVNGWFFKAFHTYNQTTDDLHYIDRTYVFLPESVVDTLIENEKQYIIKQVASNSDHLNPLMSTYGW